ncbi:hypothetical protein SAMN05660337_3245 [Maridesulfovibrio ferrireducens]|uniref:Cas5fv helical domain-containing protein n=1 Tax=Maridesulfovibrio ferrireducens TaxID=246191 RepID=A0A1G9KX17_9BACT|nr:type I-Fv CRISPR-associated protein Cas5fv [Maridesulfovibrio ferrireducens]SDL54251.1 hypothetical protein SAMN05660337_3245 [Maridesulfovibrio ferrireducens]
MKIILKYESSWRNSFLDGSNNEPLPKEGRKFVGSMTNLKKPDNFIKREVTIDTVMGVLNRLIGDQKKLYQSRQSESYYFNNIEDQISFVDTPSSITNEMTYIRNITGSTDQNSYTGMVKTNDPIFQSDYSKEFWGVLFLELPNLCEFIINNSKINQTLTMDPLSIAERIESFDKLKAIEKEGSIQTAFEILQKNFPDFKGVNAKGLVIPRSLYCSALYLQLERLSGIYDTDSAKTKAGGIGGISKNGFTKKDFMSRYTTGEKKKIWGNPYYCEEFIKGEGKTRKLMTKASGTLEIKIDVDRKQGQEIAQLIENAGVSSFYLGKKGLAYVTKIKA